MTTLTLLNKVNQDTVGAAEQWNGGAADIFVTASDFGSGTVTLQRSNDGGITWVPVKFEDGVIFSATVNGVFPANGWSNGTKIRATLAGSTNPVDVKVTV